MAGKRRDFITALRAKTVTEGEAAIISELKQASPSAGVLTQTFAPFSYMYTPAKQYEQGGSDEN